MATSKSVAKTNMVTEDLAVSFVSFDDAANYFESNGGVGSANLFTLVKKEEMEGVPHLIVRFSEIVDKVTARTYMNVQAITQDNRKVTYNDGGNGIMKTLNEYREATGRNGGFLTKGLTLSEYATVINGKTELGRTWYLA